MPTSAQQHLLVLPCAWTVTPSCQKQFLSVVKQWQIQHCPNHTNNKNPNDVHCYYSQAGPYVSISFTHPLLILLQKLQNISFSLAKINELISPAMFASTLSLKIFQKQQIKPGPTEVLQSRAQNPR